MVISKIKSGGKGKTAALKPAKRTPRKKTVIRAKKPSVAKAGTKNDFPVVAVGASAGGIEAFKEFISQIHAKSGIAIVYILHMSVDRKSILNVVLGRYTDFKVQLVSGPTEIKPATIYIAPPDKEIAILGGWINPMEMLPAHGVRYPIDYFFRSLADDRRERAICLLLSGAGSDGTLGLKAVKGRGGLAMVQNPDSAKYDRMPLSAITSGYVDYILPPKQLAAQLIKYLKHPYIARTEKGKGAIAGDRENFPRVFAIVRGQTGHDFSGYKKDYLTRRIEKRMAITQVDSLAAYLKYLKNSPQEVEALFREFMIGVTKFFRDPAAYRAFREEALPGLVNRKASTDPIRIWVPGCSTGEEAYSLAIVLREYLSDNNLNREWQIFATDIDNVALEKARRAEFPDQIAADIGQQRLEKNFDHRGNKYVIKKNIRENMVFAAQNTIKDPPYSRLDIISCRNLLIYLSSELQHKLLPVFHYVLNENGILFLGPYESVSRHDNLFKPIDKKWKIYRRKNTISDQRAISRMTTGSLEGGGGGLPLVPPRESKKDIDPQKVTERYLLEKYSPDVLMADEAGNILYMHGQISRFLEHGTGKPSLNILDIANSGFRSLLGPLMRKAVQSRKEVRIKGVRLKINGADRKLNITIRPVKEADNLYLMVFDLTKDGKESRESAAGKTVSAPQERLARSLKMELDLTRENLQNTIEDLKASNEEIQSSNEELLSTNEEMETSKEELQSVNEELTTVNTELQGKIEELTRANNDIDNLLSSTEIATVFLDMDFRIRRFTSHISKILNLIESDLGRPMTQIATNLKGIDILTEVRTMLKTLALREKEVQMKNGSHYLMRIMPYRTASGGVDGTIIVFVKLIKYKPVH